MSSNEEARAREQFLADIIRELSRQQEEDAAGFAGLQRPDEAAVYRKLCFDFPLVSEDDLAQLCNSITNLVEISSKAGMPLGGTFERDFSLHEKFLENILFLCNSHANDADVTQASTANNGAIARFKIAAVMFMRFPQYLLQCSDQRLMQLLGQDQLQRSWKDILLRFQSFVMLSTVSTIGSSASNGIAQYLQESGCLGSLSDTIAVLGGFTVQAERIIADTEARTTADGTSPASQEPGEMPEAVASAGRDPLDNLLSIGMLSADAVAEPGTSDRKKRVRSLKDLLQYVLVTATVYLSTSASNKTNEAGTSIDHTRAAPMEQLSGVLSVVKACWLHLVFLHRDLLTQYPALIATKATALFSALQNSNGDAGSKMVGKNGSDFPSAAECMYVLVFTTLAAHTASLGVGANNNSTTGGSSFVAQTKAALRAHLDSKSNLAEFVDLCVRMDKYATRNASASDTAVLRIDADVQGFLVEAAMLYVDDPARVSTRSGVILQGGAVSVLVASRLLPTLLFSAQAILAHAKAQTVPVAPGLILFAARLLRFLTLLPVCSAQGSASSVLKYIVDFPDLLSSLAALAHSWQLSSAPPSETTATTTATATADHSLLHSKRVLVSPIEVLGLSATLLLSVLQVQWSSATSSAAAGLGSAVVVDGLLTCLEVSIARVQSEMQQVLKALPDLLVALQSKQASSTERSEPDTEPESESTAELPGAFATGADDALDSESPAEQMSSLEDIQKRIASAALSHDSDSDNEEAKPAAEKDPSAGLNSGAPPSVDAAAIEARKQRKLSSHQYNAMVAQLTSVGDVLAVLAGEGACAPTLRRMCAVIALEKQKNVSSVHIIVQQKLVQFVGELAGCTTELLQALRGTSDTVESAAAPGATNKAAVGGGSAQLGAKMEAVKKHLKALQGLLQGGTSNKAD